MCRKLCVLFLFLVAVAFGCVIVIVGHNGISVSERPLSHEVSATIENSCPEKDEHSQPPTSAVTESPSLPSDMMRLEADIRQFLGQRSEVWSVYVKNLDTNEAVSLYNQPMEAASLIKLYVMQSCYRYRSEIIANDTIYTGDSRVSEARLDELLYAMIAWSDNEAYNELVRMHSANRDFNEGCLLIQSEIPYSSTGIYHSLLPSDTTMTGISYEQNHTSVADCAALLESIARGTCVSANASREMLELLSQQQFREKIPAGLPKNVFCANKTGENDHVQHDVAMIYGEQCAYILCVMVKNCADGWYTSQGMTTLSTLVYDALNSVCE